MKKNKKNNRMVILAVIVLLLLVCAAAYGVSIKGNKTVEADSEEFEEFEEQEGEMGEVGDFEGELIEPLEEEIEEPQEEEKTDAAENKAESRKTDHTTATGTRPYYIRVNKQANVVTVYGKDANGNYTVPVRAMVCSTGSYTPPCGKYPRTAYKTTGYKARWNYLQGAVYGQYATQITGNILFHSVPYTQKDPSALEYWEYDKLGTSASLGCIRLTVRDAKWIYDNISSGTTVEFYSDSNPGPLGKPGAQKVSSNVECRGWDPTAPEAENPWKNVKQEEPKQEEPKKEEKTNTVNTNTEVTKPANTEKTNSEKANTTVDKTNTEKTNTQTDKTNTEKTNTQVDRTNSEKTNSVVNRTNSVTDKTNTQADNSNTKKTNTQADKTNSQKTNTTSTKTNTEKN